MIHGDIKLDNFLVGCTLDDIKLTDFGLATSYDQNDPPTCMCGSLPNVAPEILSEDSYDFKVDCWALGIILHELLGHDLPFYSHDHE